MKPYPPEGYRYLDSLDLGREVLLRESDGRVFGKYNDGSTNTIYVKDGYFGGSWSPISDSDMEFFNAMRDFYTIEPSGTQMCDRLIYHIAGLICQLGGTGETQPLSVYIADLANLKLLLVDLAKKSQ